MNKEDVKLLLYGLAHCIGNSADENELERTGDCTDCPLTHECNWTTARALELCMDAILSLNEERDALLCDLRMADSFDCCHCKHYAFCDNCDCVDCSCHSCNDNSNWEWRGVPKEDA